MATKTSAPDRTSPPPVKSLHGIAVCLFSALCAELIFESFLKASGQYDPPARVLIVFLSLLIIHRFALVSLRRYNRRVKDIVFIHAVLIAQLAAVGLGRLFALALTNYISHSHYAGMFTPEALYFAIPYAAGALLIQAVLGLNHGLVFSLNLALITGIYMPDANLFVPFVLVSNFVACLSLRRFRSRSDYVRAGLNIALVSLPFALAAFISGRTINISQLTVGIPAALFGGIICSFIVAGVTPIVEHLFGYVTDMRLLEMATLDQPLLKELSITAPGTWNHSMVIGMMVEAAADAIGANPVLARVGAYFHDLGKVKKPLYFVENQAGDNRHDKLSTSMSALIIRSHVKDGIELARKYKLPEPIVDMIPQHHGTSLIEYFYEKACKEAAESGEEAVDRSLYSYPGPKPQTREAALLMLADGIEAAARTIPEPTADRIQGMVQKMINKVFASGELNECELTLKDLHAIAKCFTRVLNGIYHQRIAYAEPAEKGAERPAPKTASEPPEEGAKTENGKKPEKRKEEDLKRLGI